METSLEYLFATQSSLKRTLFEERAPDVRKGILRGQIKWTCTKCGMYLLTKKSVKKQPEGRSPKYYSHKCIVENKEVIIWKYSLNYSGKECVDERVRPIVPYRTNFENIEYISNLPQEVMLSVIEHLNDFITLVNLQRTCKYFYSIVNKEILYAKVHPVDKVLVTEPTEKELKILLWIRTFLHPDYLALYYLIHEHVTLKKFNGYILANKEFEDLRIVRYGDGDCPSGATLMHFDTKPYTNGIYFKSATIQRLPPELSNPVLVSRQFVLDRQVVDEKRPTLLNFAYALSFIKNKLL